MKIYMFRTVPLSIVRSFPLYTQQWYMSYRFADSLWAGAFAPAHKLLACRPANRQSTGKQNTYQLLYIYSITPDDELQICPKHVEVDWRNNLRINIASSWFLLHRSYHSSVHTKQIKAKSVTLFSVEFPLVRLPYWQHYFGGNRNWVMACAEFDFWYVKALTTRRRGG